MKPALFLDRDGVINREVHRLYRIEDCEFIEGVFKTCQFFQQRDYKIIIVTNQSGIGRGHYTETDFQTLTNWMVHKFAQQKVKITQTYFSPYHPTCGIGHYACDHQDRKPNPGMLLRAQKDWQIDLSQSIMVGDKESDILAGLNAGVRTTVLVRSGHAIDEAITKASMIIDSIADLPTLLPALSKK